MEAHEITLGALELCSDLIADAIVKKTCPRKDGISELEAKRRYGAKWLRENNRRGIIKPFRMGGRIVYSVHELDCAVAAGMDNYLEVMKIIHKDEE